MVTFNKNETEATNIEADGYLVCRSTDGSIIVESSIVSIREAAQMIEAMNPDEQAQAFLYPVIINVPGSQIIAQMFKIKLETIAKNAAEIEKLIRERN